MTVYYSLYGQLLDINNLYKGFKTINEDNLNALSQDKLTRLHNAGFLQAIYMVIASQVHIHDLVARKNAQLAS